MKPELEEKIVKKYPEFFEYLKEHKSKVILPMMFGFEHEDGWFVILDTLFNSIHRYCKYNKKPYPDVVQVKEKYGQLEVYISGGNTLIDGMIWFAGDLSVRTCERCGTTEKVGQTKGWVYTICESCREKDERALALEFSIK